MACQCGGTNSWAGSPFLKVFHPRSSLLGRILSVLMHGTLRSFLHQGMSHGYMTPWVATSDISLHHLHLNSWLSHDVLQLLLPHSVHSRDVPMSQSPHNPLISLFPTAAAVGLLWPRTWGWCFAPSVLPFPCSPGPHREPESHYSEPVSFISHHSVFLGIFWKLWVSITPMLRSLNSYFWEEEAFFGTQQHPTLPSRWRHLCPEVWVNSGWPRDLQVFIKHV